MGHPNLSQRAVAAFLTAIADIISGTLLKDGRGENLQDLAKALRERLNRRFEVVRKSDHPLSQKETEEWNALCEVFLNALSLSYLNREEAGRG